MLSSALSATRRSVLNPAIPHIAFFQQKAWRLVAPGSLRSWLRGDTFRGNAMYLGAKMTPIEDCLDVVYARCQAFVEPFYQLLRNSVLAQRRKHAAVQVSDIRPEAPFGDRPDADERVHPL